MLTSADPQENVFVCFEDVSTGELLQHRCHITPHIVLVRKKNCSSFYVASLLDSCEAQAENNVMRRMQRTKDGKQRGKI